MGELLDLIRKVHGLPTYEEECKDKKIENQDMKEHMKQQYKMLGILTDEDETQ